MNIDKTYDKFDNFIEIILVKEMAKFQGFSNVLKYLKYLISC